MERVILHCDANSYYASVECLYTPAIRALPVAVGGDIKARHGIILTKNALAKSFGVRTGEAIWQAKRKCPGLVLVPPDFPLYVRFSAKLRRIYEQYSDKVEPFGLDEAWVDVTAPGITLRDGVRIADEIRRRVRDELGITVSVGIADNKAFAKLGSDMKKPDAVTLLRPQDYARRVYPLPVGELLYVGPSTRRRLAALGILTIGDLARCESTVLQRILGKAALTLKAYACGQDASPVAPTDRHTQVKSVGNSTTPPHDIRDMDDARCIYYLLAESVASRLRKGGFRARCLSISARSSQLVTRSCQMTLPRPSCLTDELAQAAMTLFSQRFACGFPYRSAGLTCTMLSAQNEPIQLDFTGEEERRIHMEQLEHSIDSLRIRYGSQIITRGAVLLDKDSASSAPAPFHPFSPTSLCLEEEMA